MEQLAFKIQDSSGIVPLMEEISSQSNEPSGFDNSELTSLLQAVSLKDRRAFEILYDATSRKLFSIAYRITQRPEIAEEVLSEVYLQIWRQADRFDPTRGAALAWMTVLCRSRALDMMRKQPKAKLLSIEHNSGYLPEDTEVQQPMDLLVTVERNTALHDALARLNDQERQMLALAYFRDFSHSELARYTGLPLGTVKTQLRRSIEKLKNLMNGGSHE